MTIIIGGMNAKIRRGKSGDLFEDHSLGVRNECGEIMKIFVEDEDLVVLNDCFKLQPRRLYTWISPRDEPGGIVRDQIHQLHRFITCLLKSILEIAF